MICPECKNEIGTDEVVCHNCGYRIYELTGNPSPITTAVDEDMESQGISDRFKIKDTINQGGMGTVFKAVDKLTHEVVALKIIKKSLSGDKTISKRFIEEVRNSQKITHTNVVAPKNVDRLLDGRLFYTMDFIEGKTLGQLIHEKKGNFPVDEIEQIVNMICDALNAAHEKNIVHRDLKPSNIIIDRDGFPHILDFGISKNIDPNVESLFVTNSHDIVGTPMYMSPEQYQKHPIDQRSDIYSLGVIMYELAVGRPPFTGKSYSDLQNAHLTQKPEPPHKVNNKIPRYLSNTILKCLMKNPDYRFDNVEEIQWALANKAIGTTTYTIPGYIKHRRKMQFGMFALLGIAVLLLGLNLLRSNYSSSSESRIRFSAQRITYSDCIEHDPVISPDHTRLVFSSDREGRFGIVMQPLRGGNQLILTNGETGPCFQPVMSNDGNHIFFQSGLESQGIFRMSNIGGTPMQVCKTGISPAVNHKGTHLCYVDFPQDSDFSRVFLMDLSSDERLVVSARGPKYDNHEFPNWSPDDRHLVFVSGDSLQIVDAGGQKVWQVFRQPDAELKDPYWAQQGTKMFFISDAGGFNDIWMLRLDTTSEGFPVKGVEQVTVCANARSLYVDNSGDMLCFSDLRQRESIYALNMKTGKMEPLNKRNAAGKDYQPQVSPDGRFIAFISDRTGVDELYTLDLRTHKETQITSDRCEKRWPSWSPDGRYISFCSFRTGNGDIYRVEAKGGIPHRLTQSNDYEGAPHWSPDGNRIAFNLRKDNNYMIAVIPAIGGEIKALTQDPGDEYDPCWSPDGCKILYVKDRNIMLMNPDGTEKKKLLKGGLPVLSQNGLKIYFYKNGEIWSAKRDTSGVLIENSSEQLTSVSSPKASIDEDWKFSFYEDMLYFSVIETLNSDVILLEKEDR